MSEIKLQLHLPNKSMSTIFVDSGDKIVDWISDIKKDNLINGASDEVQIAKNNIPINQYLTFYEAGFKNGDQLNIIKANETIIEEKVINSSKKNIPLSQIAPGSVLPRPVSSQKPASSRPPSQKSFSDNSINQQVNSHAVQPSDSKNKVFKTTFFVLFFLLAGGFIFYKFQIGSNDRESTIDSSSTIPQITIPKQKLTHNTSTRQTDVHVENKEPEKEDAEEPAPDDSEDDSNDTIEGYFEKLSDPDIADDRKENIKSYLLDLFVSEDVPVIKMHNGKQTNTDTRIGDYIESVILLNTKIIVGNTELVDDKVSKIYVTEER